MQVRAYLTSPHILSIKLLYLATGCTSRQRVTLFWKVTTLHTSICVFFMGTGLWCLWVRPWVGGGWGLCGRLGPNEKLHNSGLLCLFTLSHSCQDLEDGGGKVRATLHDWNRSRRLLWLHSFRFYITENLWRYTETINSACGSNVQLSCNHINNRTISLKQHKQLEIETINPTLWKVSHLSQRFCFPLSSDFLWFIYMVLLSGCVICLVSRRTVRWCSEPASPRACQSCCHGRWRHPDRRNQSRGKNLKTELERTCTENKIKSPSIGGYCQFFHGQVFLNVLLYKIQCDKFILFIQWQRIYSLGWCSGWAALAETVMWAESLLPQHTESNHALNYDH